MLPLAKVSHGTSVWLAAFIFLSCRSSSHIKLSADLSLHHVALFRPFPRLCWTSLGSASAYIATEAGKAVGYLPGLAEHMDERKARRVFLYPESGSLLSYKHEPSFSYRLQTSTVPCTDGFGGWDASFAIPCSVPASHACIWLTSEGPRRRLTRAKV